MTEEFKGCGHGKTWAEPCPQCEEISHLSMLRYLHSSAKRCAAFYETNPGLASDPRVIIDLYHTVAGLVETVGASLTSQDGKNP